MPSLDPATRAMVLPSLAIAAVVVYAAIVASRDSRTSLRDGAARAAALISEDLVAELAENGDLPAVPKGAEARLISETGAGPFQKPQTVVDTAALEKAMTLAAANENASLSWTDRLGDGRLRLRQCRPISLEMPGAQGSWSGALLVSMDLEGADALLYDRAVMRTAWIIFGGVFAFGSMIGCVRWVLGGYIQTAEDRLSNAAALIGSTGPSEQAEQTAMERLLREAQELAAMAAESSAKPEKDVSAIPERMESIADHLAAASLNTAIAGANAGDDEEAFLEAAENVRRLSAETHALAEELRDGEHAADGEGRADALARAEFLLKRAEDAAAKQEEHRTSVESMRASVYNAIGREPTGPRRGSITSNAGGSID